MNLLAKLVARATTPNVSGVTPTSVAADVVKYGGLVIAVLSVVENAFPGAGVPGQWQAVIDAVITVLTGILSVEKQQAVATAKAVAKVSSRAKKAAK